MARCVLEEGFAHAPGGARSLNSAAEFSNSTNGVWPLRRYAWFVVALLMLSYAFGVVDRIVIGLLVEQIKGDLGLTDTQIGALQGVAFGLFYALLALPVGLLVDRWRRVPVIWMGLLIWSAATVASGFMYTFLGLFLARVFVGAGESTTTPGSASLIADYFPPAERPQAFGLFNMGGSVGIGAGYLLSGAAIAVGAQLQQFWPALLGGLRDWQVVFIAVGTPGVLLAVLIALAVREPARQGSTATTPRLSLLPLWAELKTNRAALLTVMLGTIMNVMIVNAHLAWFPSMFRRVFGWDSVQVANALAAVGVPFGMFSALTSGLVLSWLVKRARRDGPLIVLGVQCAAWAIFGTLKNLAPTATWALALHVGTSLFAVWAVTAAFTAINQITPNRLRGQMMALYTLLTGFVGVALGPLAVGLLTDNFFTDPRGIGPALAVVCAVGGTLGVLIPWRGRHAYRAAAERAAGAG